MKRAHLSNIVFTALFAALILAVTRLSVPIALGYIHLGDAMIYLAALILPAPYAAAAAAIGAGLADFTAGYAVYVLPSFVIKTLLVLAAKGLCRLSGKPAIQDGLVCAAGIITVVGYYLADAVIALAAGSDPAAAFTGALSGIPFNAIQAAASGALYFLLAAAVRKGFQKYL